MRTVRIAILGASPCDQCTAACCKQKAWAHAVLLQDEAERRRFAAWSELALLKDADGATRRVQVIAYRDGRCPFLGGDDRCTIYDARPQSCRDFECTRHFGYGDGFLAANPQVKTLLARWNG